MKLLPINLAIYGSLFILSGSVVFHLLVLTGVVPFTIVWGGNLAEKSQVYLMESVSIAINLLMVFVLLNYSGLIKLNIHRKIIIGFIWLMGGLFLLNTVGNLLAKSSAETYIFTPLTFMLALFCFRIAAFESEQKKPV